MPLARTWSEELVAEWLTLQGYMVVTGLPAGKGLRGGRKEADVVGARADAGRLQIWHIEVGNLGSSLKENTDRVKNKFSHDREEAVTSYFGGIFPGLPVHYCRRYIAPYVAQRQVEPLQKALGDISFQKLSCFLKTEVLPKLHKDYTDARRTPPEGLWLLHLLSFLLDWWIIPPRPEPPVGG